MSRSSEADLDMVVEPSSRVYVRAVGSCGGDEPLLALPMGLGAVPVSATSVGSKPSELPSASVLWRAAGGRRYASALVVDSVGDGLLRPFVLL